MSDILLILTIITFFYCLLVGFFKLMFITYINMRLKKSLSFIQIGKLLFYKVENWEEKIKGWEE